MKDAIEIIIKNLELFIRYFLVGVAITTTYLLSLTCNDYYTCRMIDNLFLTAIIVFFIGILAFTFYRVIVWSIGELIWPCLNEGLCKGITACTWTCLKKRSYKGMTACISTCYKKGLYKDMAANHAKVLKWRRSKNFDETLSSYLHIRWATIHFCFLTSITTAFSIIFKQTDSFVSSNLVFVKTFTVLIFSFAIFQMIFLLKTEKALFTQETNENQKN